MTYSAYCYKINTIYNQPGYTWIFLPGGPGLGCTYLKTLCTFLKLPGTTLLVDFPKDGHNKEGQLHLNYWKRGLIDLVSSYSQSILVTHDFSGLLALDTPELEPYLVGLVLMNTSTANTMFDQVRAMQSRHNLPDLVPAAAEYHLNPSDVTFKKFWGVYKHYFYTKEELPNEEEFSTLFAFNSVCYQYVIERFYPGFRCQWYPNIPTLTISSENDYICSPQVFINDNKFHKANIINKLITDAGHCPWIKQKNSVAACFAELIRSFKS